MKRSKEPGSDLTCPICSKTFENNKKAVRHARYCRTKARDGVPTRRNSCAACVKAKTRCDRSLAKCSRCFHKRLECIYESSNTSSNVGLQGLSVNELVLLPNGPPEESVSDSSLEHICTGRESSIHPPRHFIGVDSVDNTLPTDLWAESRSNPGAANVDGTAFSDSVRDLISWNYPFETSFLTQIYYFKDRIVLGTYYVFRLTPSFVPLDKRTILQKRDLKAGPHGSALSRAYCMATLRSYPQLMCRNSGAPLPFIHLNSHHSRWEANQDCAVSLPEPLAICSSIMQMYVTRTPESLAFIWRTIQAEAQRLESEYRSYDPWDTIYSIQAMTLYLILGLLGDSSEYVADEHILMSILGITKNMADKYRSTSWMCNGEIDQDQVPLWEEWALAESRRRTAIIIALIIHIFNIEHGHGLPQCGGFAELSLPCSKLLWQAPDRVSWEKEYRRQYMIDGMSLKKIPTYRDLLPELEDIDDSASGSRAEWISEWFSGMDELGTLVMMAVSML